MRATGKKKSSRNQPWVFLQSWTELKAAPGKVQFLEDGQTTTTDRKNNCEEAGS